MRMHPESEYNGGEHEWKIPKPAERPEIKKKMNLFGLDLETVIKIKDKGEEINATDIEILVKRIDEQFNEVSALYHLLKKEKNVQAEGWKEMAEKNPTFAAEYHDWQEQKLKLSFLEGRLTKKEQETLAQTLKGKPVVTNVAGETDSEMDKTLPYTSEESESIDTNVRRTELEGSKANMQENAWSDLQEISEKLKGLRGKLATHKNKRPLLFGLAKWKKEEEVLAREIEGLEKRAKGLQNIGTGDFEKRKEPKKGTIIPFRENARHDTKHSETRHYGKVAAVAAGVLVGISPAGKDVSSPTTPPEEPAAHGLKITAGQPAEENAEAFLTRGVSSPPDTMKAIPDTTTPRDKKHRNASNRTKRVDTEGTEKIRFSKASIPIYNYPEKHEELFGQKGGKIVTPTKIEPGEPGERRIGEEEGVKYEPFDKKT